MGSRLSLLVLPISLLIGIALGIYTATSFNDTSAAPNPQQLEMTASAQDDYILIVADAYAADADLQLAKDRLARLRDLQIKTRVEDFAIRYASRRDQPSINLIQLALALGSRNRGLIAVVVTTTPTALPSPTRENAPVFSNVRATSAPTPTPSPVPTNTAEPVFIVVPNANPFVVLPTNTPTITNTPTATNTRRPNTRVPTPTELPTATAVPPPPPVDWEPGYPGGWPPGVYFEPANVEPGQGYWHLTRAVYCDFVEDNFGCPDRPGNRNGTSIYVMDGGNPINVYAPGGKNVGGDPTQIGDPKAQDDMCECSWTFLVSDYKISVAGAPSDAIGGFSLYTVGGNVLAGHAHVRYFLYFDYITR